MATKSRISFSILLVLLFNTAMAQTNNAKAPGAKPQKKPITNPDPGAAAIPDPQAADPNKGTSPTNGQGKGGNSAPTVGAAQVASPKKKRPAADPLPDSLFSDSFFDEFTSTTPGPTKPPPKIDLNPKRKILIIKKPGGPPATAVDGSVCDKTYRVHPTEKTKYLMRFPEGTWMAMDCSPSLGNGLIWRQDLCNCGEELVPMDPDDWCGVLGFMPSATNKHKYLRKHHGSNAEMDCPANLVWSQKNCFCLYDPTIVGRPIQNTVTFVCRTILNMTFEKDLRNNAGNYQIKPVELNDRGRLKRLRFVKIPGATNFAAEILSSPLEFLAFSGNDFQKQVTYVMNFKIHPRRRQSNQFMVLFTDGCRRDESGLQKEWPSSFNLTFQPKTDSFRLVFRTKHSMVDEIIPGAKADANGWFKTVVYFEDSTVNLEVNGKKVFTATSVEGKLPPNKCPLYIAGRSKGFDMSDHFFGFMDNIYLVKDCKFHDANIKIL